MPNIKGISNINGNITIKMLDDSNYQLERVNLAKLGKDISSEDFGSLWVRKYRGLKNKIMFEDKDQSLKTIMENWFFPIKSVSASITDNPDFNIYVHLYTDRNMRNQNRTEITVTKKD